VDGRTDRLFVFLGADDELCINIAHKPRHASLALADVNLLEFVVSNIRVTQRGDLGRGVAGHIGQRAGALVARVASLDGGSLEHALHGEIALWSLTASGGAGTQLRWQGLALAGAGCRRETGARQPELQSKIEIGASIFWGQFGPLRLGPERA